MLSLEHLERCIERLWMLNALIKGMSFEVGISAFGLVRKGLSEKPSGLCSCGQSLFTSPSHQSNCLGQISLQMKMHQYCHLLMGLHGSVSTLNRDLPLALPHLAILFSTA